MRRFGVQSSIADVFIGIDIQLIKRWFLKGISIRQTHIHPIGPFGQKRESPRWRIIGAILVVEIDAISIETRSSREDDSIVPKPLFVLEKYRRRDMGEFLCIECPRNDEFVASRQEWIALDKVVGSNVLIFKDETSC